MRFIKVQAYLTAMLIRNKRKMPSLTHFLQERRTRALGSGEASAYRQEMQDMAAEAQQFIEQRKEKRRGVQRSTR